MVTVRAMQKKQKTPEKPEKTVKGENTTLKRKWRYWRVESSISCNLNCEMCPWERDLRSVAGKGIMSEETWGAVAKNLGDIEQIEFSGGSQGGFNENLPAWISTAASAGCKVGLLTRGELLTPDTITGILSAGLNWVTIPVDGATPQLYERFVRGVRYNRLIENIKNLVEKSQANSVLVNINYIVSSENIYQLPEITRLFADIGIDRLNFRHCDEIRYDREKRAGLTFGGDRKLLNYYEKEIAHAFRAAKKKKIEVTSFPFRPEELPVCSKDPRDSLFIRSDGIAAPCISAAYGGRTAFLGTEVFMPTVHYGNINRSDVEDLWQSGKCMYLRNVFDEREKSYSQAVQSMDSRASILRFKSEMKSALNTIPAAPEWCRSCHYLYGI